MVRRPPGVDPAADLPPASVRCAGGSEWLPEAVSAAERALRGVVTARCRCVGVVYWHVTAAQLGDVCAGCGYARCRIVTRHSHPPRGERCRICAGEQPERDDAAAGGREARGDGVDRGATVEVTHREQPYPTLTTSRVWRRLAHRPTSFVSFGGQSVAELLGALSEPTARVYLVGPRPGASNAGARAWATGDLPAGWSSEHDHYLEGQAPVFRYVGPWGPVEIHRASAFFGDREYSTDDAGGAYDELRRVIAKAFDGAELLATPATTGRELFQRSIPQGIEWPVLDMGTQEEIRETSGHGRIEVVPHAGDLPGLAVYDGRFMYAALCWGLAGGVPTRDTVDEYAQQQRGRYRVTFTVPKGWDHVGILPSRAHEGWQYPSSPGEIATSWVDGAELHVALLHEWPVVIHERLLFPRYTTAGPLDAWARKLVGLRDAAPNELVRAGLRAIVLHASGAFHGTPHVVTRAVALDSTDTIPAHAVNLRVDGEQMVYGDPHAQAWPQLAHPEWSSAVWARARARLLSGPGRTGALHVPPGNVVAFRTDALYLTQRTAWADDGKVGRLRLQSWREGPLPAPRTHAELLAVRDG